MSQDDNNEPKRNRHELSGIERRLEEIERRELGGCWRDTWMQSLDRIPGEHRILLALVVAYPIEAVLMSHFNCPPIAFYVAGALTGLAIFFSRWAPINANHRKTNQTNSRRASQSAD